MPSKKVRYHSSKEIEDTLRTSHNWRERRILERIPPGWEICPEGSPVSNDHQSWDYNRCVWVKRRPTAGGTEAKRTVYRYIINGGRHTISVRRRLCFQLLPETEA